MFKRMCASLFVLSLVFLAMPLLASAQVATGKYKFIMDDELSKYVEFDAKAGERGGATGYMIFTDEAKVVVQDPDGEPVKDDPIPFSMKADLDTMTVEKNRAVISGIVRDSSVRSYIGRWVQLVIEDNDGVEVPDRFGWSFCEPEVGGWIPSDAEVPDDKGAFLSWWATDAERRDDVGIPSPNIVPGMLKACKVNPLSSYEFASILKGDGAIQIQQ
ncbi:MAG TPA: hypothetical protein VFB65_20965 [Pyrinomonadaceae bacterium]|nr:hypothetical protein [Pyrinomonadaceae bacterium]